MAWEQGKRSLYIERSLISDKLIQIKKLVNNDTSRFWTKKV